MFFESSEEKAVSLSKGRTFQTEAEADACLCFVLLCFVSVLLKNSEQISKTRVDLEGRGV